MTKNFNLTVDATVVAKEFKPSTEAWEKDGKTYPATGKRWFVYFLYGDRYFDKPIFEGAPQLIRAQVTKEVYKTIEDYTSVKLELECYDSLYSMRNQVLFCDSFDVITREPRAKAIDEDDR